MLGEGKSLGSCSWTVGHGPSMETTSGLPRAPAGHAAVGNAALATDMYSTGFPGAGGEMKAQGSSQVHSRVPASLQHNSLCAGLVEGIFVML